jgi:tetratricopeptide (TPR) repeat protein
MKVSFKSAQWFLLVLSLLLCAGCFRSPNERKQRYLDSGKRYLKNAKYQEAIIQFQNAIQIDKNFAPAHYQLAQCFLRQGLLPSVFRELSYTVNLDPKNWQAQLDLANLLFEARHFQEAKDHALFILKEQSNELGAQILLASSDAELGNLEAGLQEAQKAVQLAPDKPGPYLTYGLLQEKAQQIAAAEQTLQKAVAIDPKYLPAHMGLGSLYQKQQKWTAAESEYRAAVETDHTNLIAHMSLVSFYLAWGKKDLAEQALKDAKKDLPNDPAMYQRLGDFYLANSEPEKAFSEVASVYQQHPNELMAKKRYIELLIQHNQIDQAVKLNEEILKQNSKDAEALTFKGQILNLQQKSADAVSVLEAAVKSNPAGPVGHYQLGVAYATTGNVSGAEKEWREAVKLNPQMLDAQARLASLALRKGDIILLEESASQWLKFYPSAPQGYLMRGIARMKRGDVSGAEVDLRKAIELDPKSVLGCTGLADLFAAQKHFQEAQKFYEQALDSDPRFTAALQGLVNLYLFQKQPQKAIERLRAQIAKTPDDSDSYLLLGKSLLANHNSAEAQAALEKAVGLDKFNTNAFLLLAQLQDTSGQTDQAASTYQRAIQANPREIRLYDALAGLEDRRHNWQSAQELYKKVIAIQPDEPMASNNLSYSLLEHGGDINYALSLAQVARQAMPNSPATADTLAWANYKIGNYSSATNLSQEAITKDPQNPTYHYHLGLIYQKLDKVALARSSFQRVIQLDPKSTRSDEVRRILVSLDKSK